jgi:hypothetical protein
MPDKNIDTLLHHSVVCAHGGVELHACQEQRQFNAPQCRVCTRRNRVTCLTRSETIQCATVSSVLRDE